jgi:hypothetical protein
MNHLTYASETAVPLDRLRAGENLALAEIQPVVIWLGALFLLPAAIVIGWLLFRGSGKNHDQDDREDD